MIFIVLLINTLLLVRHFLCVFKNYIAVLCFTPVSCVLFRSDLIKQFCLTVSRTELLTPQRASPFEFKSQSQAPLQNFRRALHSQPIGVRLSCLLAFLNSESELSRATYQMSVYNGIKISAKLIFVT